MPVNLRELIKSYLEECKLMQIVTASGGKPWAATVWYAYDKNFSLFFISRKNRRHSLELKENPNVAGVIAKPHETLGVKCRGIQFEGRASEVSVLELPYAFKMFTKRFPRTKQYIKSVKDIVKNFTRHRFYKILPSRMVLFDEVNFPDSPQQELALASK